MVSKLQLEEAPVCSGCSGNRTAWLIDSSELEATAP